MADTRVPDAKIEELLALEEKASIGPWREGLAGDSRIYGPDGCSGNSGLVASFARYQDRPFIAASRNNLRSILLELREWRAAADRNPLVNPIRGDELQCRDDRVLIEFADDRTVSYRYRSPGNESWSPIHSATLSTYREWPATSVVRRADPIAGRTRRKKESKDAGNESF